MRHAGVGVSNTCAHARARTRLVGVHAYTLRMLQGFACGVVHRQEKRFRNHGQHAGIPFCMFSRHQKTAGAKRYTAGAKRYMAGAKRYTSGSECSRNDWFLKHSGLLEE